MVIRDRDVMNEFNDIRRQFLRDNNESRFYKRLGLLARRNNISPKRFIRYARRIAFSEKKLFRGFL